MREEFVDTAKLLARTAHRKPRQADLRRAVSTAYYALFSSLAGAVADCLVGRTHAARKSERWNRVFRALNHKQAKDFFESVLNKPHRQSIHRIGRRFVTLQKQRHSADYDSHARFTRADAEASIQHAEESINDLKSLSIDEWSALAIDLLFRTR